MLATMHPEDVKAGLRKRYGTVADFERAKGLPPKSVTEVLRGRAWQRVSDAIECALQEEEPPHPLSEFSDSSEESEDAHRLNRAAN
jgi:lambda repressor-like predicted transcriptional regulator